MLTLFAVVQTTSTTSDGATNPANHAMSGTRGSGFTHDPYFDSDGNPTIPAMSAEGKGGSSLAKDPIHRHVEVGERLGGGRLR